MKAGKLLAASQLIKGFPCSGLTTDEIIKLLALDKELDSHSILIRNKRLDVFKGFDINTSNEMEGNRQLAIHPQRDAILAEITLIEDQEIAITTKGFLRRDIVLAGSALYKDIALNGVSILEEVLTLPVPPKPDH